MIRIICVEADYNDAAHVGGPTHVRHRTFDIDAPALEQWLIERLQYGGRSVSGVEVIADSTAELGETK